jgi:hypothetical protein
MIVTYATAVGGFAHIVVGSFGAFMLLVNLDVRVGDTPTRFLSPCCSETWSAVRRYLRCSPMRR